jgi:hypothetical protein
MKFGRIFPGTWLALAHLMILAHSRKNRIRLGIEYFQREETSQLTQSGN